MNQTTVTEPAYPILRRGVIPWVLGRMQETKGLENIPQAGPFIMVPNHISRLDPIFLSMIVARARNVKMRFLAAEYVYRVCEMLGIAQWIGLICIPSRDKGKVLEFAEQHVRQGGALGMYPEGRMNPSPTLLSGKTGAIRLSIATGAPLIPVGILGVQSRNGLWALWGWFWHPKQHGFVIGKPYQPMLAPGETLTKDSLDRLTFDMMQRIAVLCGKAVPEREAV